MKLFSLSNRKKEQRNSSAPPFNTVYTQPANSNMASPAAGARPGTAFQPPTAQSAGQQPPTVRTTPGTTFQPVPGAVRPPLSARQLLSYQVANLQGIGTCEKQEDSFAFVNVLDVTLMREQGLLAIVADGMGGMRDGRQASDAVIQSVKSSFAEFDYSADLAQQMVDSVAAANERVFRLLDGEGGSTLIACLLYQESLYFVSVGDSYLYLKRNGQLLRLNRPQNVLHMLYMESIREGNMDPSFAEENHEKAALSQFLGMEFLDDVDFLRRPLPLMPGDVLLACSDGVGGMLTEEQVLECLSLLTPRDMCEALEKNVLAASAGGYQDNYTALVLQCSY